MITPIVPPNTAFLANAAVTTVLISAGTAVMFITIITTAAIRYTVTMNGTIIDAIALIRFTPPITTTARINAMINALTHIGILIALWNPSDCICSCCRHEYRSSDHKDQGHKCTIFLPSKTSLCTISSTTTILTVNTCLIQNCQCTLCEAYC